MIRFSSHVISIFLANYTSRPHYVVNLWIVSKIKLFFVTLSQPELLQFFETINYAISWNLLFSALTMKLFNTVYNHYVEALYH